MNIFIVDDNKILADTIAESLRNYNKNWNVYVAYDAKSAIEMIPMNMPDIMFIDIMLPDMSGLEVLKEVKEIEQGIQIIIMTAYASLSNAIKALQFGALDYIQKPVHIKQIISALETAIERRNILLDTRKAVAELLKNTEGSNGTLEKLSMIEKMMILRRFQIVLKNIKNEKKLINIVYKEYAKIFRTQKIDIFKIIENNTFEIIKSYEDDNFDMNEMINEDSLLYQQVMINSIGGYLDDKNKIVAIISFENVKWGFIHMERRENFKQYEIELAEMLAIEIALKIKQIKLSKNIDSKMMGLVFALMSLIGLKDPQLKLKFEQASGLAAEFSEYIGLSIDDIERIRYNALMYNLLNGKTIDNISIGNEIIDDALNNIAINIKNAEIGEELDDKINNITEQMEFLENMKFILEAINEYYDGSGNKKLKGEHIPIDSRIITICNTFNELNEKKDYRENLNVKNILNNMKNDRGKKFDPDLFDKFYNFIGLKIKNKKVLKLF